MLGALGMTLRRMTWPDWQTEEYQEHRPRRDAFNEDAAIKTANLRTMFSTIVGLGGLEGLE